MSDLGLLHPVPYKDTHGAIVFAITQYLKVREGGGREGERKRGRGEGGREGRRKEGKERGRRWREEGRKRLTMLGLVLRDL